MLKISSQSDYGMLMISYLAGKKGLVPLSELVDKIKLPKRYLARIAGRLVKNQILASREGKVGGYRLNKKAKEISLYDYLVIFEKNMDITRCQDPHYDCRYGKYCRHRDALKNAVADNVFSKLRQLKLFSLFEK